MGTLSLKSYAPFIAQHRRLLAFGFFTALGSSFGQTYFVAIFGGALRERFDLTDGAYGAYYSAGTILSGCTLIWLGRRIDDVPLLRYTMATALGLVTACVFLGVVPVAWALLPAFFLIRLSGQGLMGHIAMTTMARAFHTGRGKALAVAGLGFPAGEAVLPICAVFLMQSIGWRETWLCIAAVVFVAYVPLARLTLAGGTRGDHDPDLPTDLDGGTDETTRGVGSGPDGSWTRREVLRDVRFYLLLPAVLAPAFILTGLFFHQVRLCEVKGWPPELFAGSLAIFAALQLPTSISAGPIIDRIGAARLMPVLLLPLVAALAALATLSGTTAVIVFMACAGTTSGLCGPVFGAMWAELYGTRHLGAVRAMASSLMVFSTGGSPFAMGALLDVGVTFPTICLACIAFCAAASVAAATTAWRATPPPQ